MQARPALSSIFRRCDSTPEMLRAAILLLLSICGLAADYVCVNRTRHITHATSPSARSGGGAVAPLANARYRDCASDESRYRRSKPHIGRGGEASPRPYFTGSSSSLVAVAWVVIGPVALRQCSLHCCTGVNGPGWGALSIVCDRPCCRAVVVMDDSVRALGM